MPFAVVLFYMVLTLSKIKYLDWERIVRFNRGSVLSFSDSGSYVPMETYSWFGFAFGFEILIVNGILTFIGLVLIRRK